MLGLEAVEGSRYHAEAPDARFQSHGWIQCHCRSSPVVNNLCTDRVEGMGWDGALDAGRSSSYVSAMSR